MNEKLQKFLNEKKQIEISKRNKHLVSLGLIDESKMTKIEHKDGVTYPEEAVFEQDPSDKKYYWTTFEAIDITEEEYKEVCKLCEYNKTPEKTLNIIANIVLGLGVILIISLFFLSSNLDNITLGISVLSISITVLYIWSTMSIFSKISSNITDIQKKLS